MLGGRFSTLHFGKIMDSKIIGEKTTDYPDLHG
jgi:hypothetical protein